MRPRILYWYKGLPGCGKSTDARKRVAESNGTAVEISKDDLRNELHGGVWSKSNEKEVVAEQNRRIEEALLSGKDVYVHDTNFDPYHRTRFQNIGTKCGADVCLIDFTDVPIEECIRRDSLRTGKAHVGEDVIRNMASRYKVVPVITEKYPDTPGLPNCIICDIDGTIANLNGRNPFDVTTVYNDLVRENVVGCVKHLVDTHNCFLFFFSGRNSKCHFDTTEWLNKKAGFSSYSYKLVMRPNGDERRDSILKNEMFDKHIRGIFNVLAVFDDRPQVLKEVWYPKGVDVFNVGNGKEF